MNAHLSDHQQWLLHNDQYNSVAIRWIHQCLKLQIAQEVTPGCDTELADLATQMQALEIGEFKPALLILSEQFGLSAFERQIVLLCLAAQLNTETASLCQQAQGFDYPCFALAFSLFNDPDWSVVNPHAPLRQALLIELPYREQAILFRALHIDERITSFLKGLNYLDVQLAEILHPCNTEDISTELTASEQATVEKIQQQVNDALNAHQAPIIELRSQEHASSQLIAQHASIAHGITLYQPSARVLSANNQQLYEFSTLWQREALLLPIGLYLIATDDNWAQLNQLLGLISHINAPVFIENNVQQKLRSTHISIETKPATSQEQYQLWHQFLPNCEAQIAQVVQQFSFSSSQIYQLAKSLNFSTTSQQETLWQACRQHARRGMQHLAQRIESNAQWDDLILAPEQMAQLKQISSQVSQRHHVYQQWGFEQKMNRGMGISALFCGESGTGKTMASEVIANALALDLYRIDLSSVVSKYIGETEKNLKRLFDSAELSGAILLFDEADALFGKRTQVKDAHDRYANIEINYLLQRIESYPGLAIMTTNLRSALDKAFVRRLRFIVSFDFPEHAQRIQLWRQVFPKETPLAADIDYSTLAKFKLSGANIHCIALNAAFLAANQESEVTMQLILDATRDEFIKLEKPVNNTLFNHLSKEVSHDNQR